MTQTNNPDAATDAVPDSVAKRWKQRWKAVPTPLRKTVVITIGVTLLAIGAILVILPGPFTLPFIFAGIAVLSSEFAWARRLMKKGQVAAQKTKKVAKRIPWPLLVLIIIVVVAAVASGVYWWFFVRT